MVTKRKVGKLTCEDFSCYLRPK